MTYGEFSNIKRTLCILFDASETSGIRSTRRNHKVGGASKSCHQIEFGYAADLVPDDMDDVDEMHEMAVKLGLFALVEADHIHIGYRTKR